MSIARRWQRGTAAIELMLVVSLGMAIMAAIVLFGRFTWHVIAMEKSVYNAARITVALPIEKLSGEGAVEAEAAGRSLVRTAAVSSGVDIVPSARVVGVFCDGNICDPAGITRVAVATSITFTDTVFGNSYTADLLPIGEGVLRFETELDYEE